VGAAQEIYDVATRVLSLPDICGKIFVKLSPVLWED
jgi:hypothetical protein